MKAVNKKDIYVILHNVRSSFNVGSIFRTADAIGISKIYLTGYTPTPLDRFGRERKDLGKVSLGAEKTVAWEAKKSLSTLLRKLKKEGVVIVAVEQDSRSIDYKKINIRKPTAFIFGNEVGGISRRILALSDSIAEIPMRGSKESLNVAVSAGIVLFRLFDF